MKIYTLGALPQELYPGVGGKAKGLDFLARHGHRCIKEAEMRNKPWREDEIPLMNYLSSIIRSPMDLEQKESVIDYRKEFDFVRNPLLKAACVSYAKKSREAVVAREYGLPAIVNVKGATKLLRDGDYIVMDAGKGKITARTRRT